jgi:hypothetical protein
MRELSFFKSLSLIHLIAISVLLYSGCSLNPFNNRNSNELEVELTKELTKTFAPVKEDSTANSATAHLKGCVKVNSIESWLKSEFPRISYELILSESDLEIWATNTDKAPIQITSLQKNGFTTHSCEFEFPSKASWEAQKARFIEDLENLIVAPDSASIKSF